MEVVINNYNTGISFTIKVSPYDLVLALKEKIQEQNKVPLEKQNLSFNGAELQNHHVSFCRKAWIGYAIFEIHPAPYSNLLPIT
ncbi:hypothetical protein AAMO2058_000847900 [Amorphochlora amoebiformis]